MNRHVKKTIPHLMKQAVSVRNALGTRVVLARTYRHLGAMIFGERFYQEPIIMSITVDANLGFC